MHVSHEGRVTREAYSQRGGGGNGGHHPNLLPLRLEQRALQAGKVCNARHQEGS